MVAEATEPPAPEPLIRRISAAADVLEREPPDTRPRDGQGRPGGIVYLSPLARTLIVPDLHGRIDFVRVLLGHPVTVDDQRVPVIDALRAGLLQIVFIGDYMHSEARGAERWRKAFGEFTGGYRRHRNMDREMTENLTCLEAVLRLKSEFPEYVTLLKGNHENIKNEDGGGNHSFRKFALEGVMVTAWMEKFYPGELLEQISRVEKALPLLCVGDYFLVSHCEPARLFAQHEVIEYRDRPDVILGLTWTDNDEAEAGSVSAMISRYLQISPDSPDWERCFHFAGHRPVPGRYLTRADGRFVQIHNPAARIVVEIAPNYPIVLNRDIIEI